MVRGSMPEAAAGKPEHLASSAVAGASYFAIVFAFGFAFGAFRTTLVAPAIGELTAVALELPFLLVCSWIVSRRLIDRLAVAATAPARLTMGSVAFVLLMVAEVGLSALLGQSVGQHFEAYRHAPGLLGLAGQIAFASLPILQLSRARCG